MKVRKNEARATSDSRTQETKKTQPAQKEKTNVRATLDLAKDVFTRLPEKVAKMRYQY